MNVICRRRLFTCCDVCFGSQSWENRVVHVVFDDSLSLLAAPLVSPVLKWIILRWILFSLHALSASLLVDIYIKYYVLVSRPFTLRRLWVSLLRGRTHIKKVLYLNQTRFLASILHLHVLTNLRFLPCIFKMWSLTSHSFWYTWLLTIMAVILNIRSLLARYLDSILHLWKFQFLFCLMYFIRFRDLYHIFIWLNYLVLVWN